MVVNRNTRRHAERNTFSACESPGKRPAATRYACILCFMTTLIMVDFRQDEPIDVSVTRRLREEFGRLGGLSVSEVARRVGMTQQALSQRMSHHVDFRLRELRAICDETGASYEYVTTGIREVPDPAHPSHPRGGPSHRTPTRGRRGGPGESRQPVGWDITAPGSSAA